MRTIYKYELEVAQEQIRALPAKAKVLSVQAQDGRVVFWAEVDTAAPIKERKFFCVGTGWEAPPEWAEYVGTIQLGQFVWHFYDGGETA